jgi:hypothetical protein
MCLFHLMPFVGKIYRPLWFYKTRQQARHVLALFFSPNRHAGMLA